MKRCIELDLRANPYTVSSSLTTSSAFAAVSSHSCSPRPVCANCKRDNHTSHPSQHSARGIPQQAQHPLHVVSALQTVPPTRAGFGLCPAPFETLEQFNGLVGHTCCCEGRKRAPPCAAASCSHWMGTGNAAKTPSPMPNSASSPGFTHHTTAAGAGHTWTESGDWRPGPSTARDVSLRRDPA
jgi:hypothetical protein